MDDLNVDLEAPGEVYQPPVLTDLGSFADVTFGHSAWGQDDTFPLWP